MKIPEDYLERVYAGWLGKVIGIRLGAAVEGWTYEKIRQVFGELWDYPAEYKNFSADDDSNGPLFFVRALEDCGDVEAFSSQDVAEALLNYAPFEHGFFWWGGYGVSTEHTAYLNLRNGIPAPRSGSIQQNGSTMAEMCIRDRPCSMRRVWPHFTRVEVLRLSSWAMLPRMDSRSSASGSSVSMPSVRKTTPMPKWRSSRV